MRITIKEVEIAKVVQKLNKLEAVSKIDTELGHIEADKVLSNFIHTLGLVEVASAYNDICKWYT